MDKNTLKKTARDEIKNFDPNYRCHEGARLIGRKLKSLDMDVIVKDGGVIYDTSYFMDDLFNDLLSDFSSDCLSNEERRELEKELEEEKPRNKKGVLHSWCEVEDNAGNIIVVDWHASLILSSTCGVDNVLIVENKKNLPHTYIPMGKAIGRWIIFLTFPPRLARLKF